MKQLVVRIKQIVISEAIAMPAGGICGRDEEGFWACYLTPRLKLRRYRTSSALRMACWWHAQYTNQPLQRVIQQHALPRLHAGARINVIARDYDISPRTVYRWIGQTRKQTQLARSHESLIKNN